MAALAMIAVCTAGQTSARSEEPYAANLEKLRAEITARLPKIDDAARRSVEGAKDARIRIDAMKKLPGLEKFLASDELDAKLAKFVVLDSGTPAGLAAFAAQGPGQKKLIDTLLADDKLMLQMAIADGPATSEKGRGSSTVPNFGKAMEIYTAIQKARPKASDGVYQRLALAVSLEHSEPVKQSNPKSATDGPEFVDPVKRYSHYEKAYDAGELDPSFDRLTTWELRYVVYGEEPDEILAWGREMLRNYRPDHIYTENDGWRYVGLVKTDVKYGSGDVKFDRPELQNYQNILMNGGVCGRRAFIGRFLCRAFGVPTTARPSRGHAALAKWTPKGWTVVLGGGWGAGWTSTPYRNDRDFLATTQARTRGPEYLKVKRAHWIGDVVGETRIYGEQDKQAPAFWNAVALAAQRQIIDESKAVALDALGEDIGEANEPTVAEKVASSPVTPEDKKFTYGAGGTILIPAAAYVKPARNTRDVTAMKSFEGGLQVFLPRFFPQGLTTLRGGTWKSEPKLCTSGTRLLSGGYGAYHNWGFRAALSHDGGNPPKERKLDLGEGVGMEFVYIPPGKFTMGGENAKEGRFECNELPKHEVTLTRGFYLGKYEVTQAQYQAVMGNNPSRSTKDPNCPVDNIGWESAKEFCLKLSDLTDQDARLPSEAEWEYAARAGSDAPWFFGDDAAKLDDYAWHKGNANGKSHPVGQKKPNPWGLYDIYGNVCERIADVYQKDYYAKGPKVDPTGPSPGVSSSMEFIVNVPKAGDYQLTAQVVTANYDQKLNVSANGAESGVAMEMPFTVGKWQESAPVTLTLKEGENTLHFWRDHPPQYGMAVKSFTLKPGAAASPSRPIAVN